MSSSRRNDDAGRPGTVGESAIPCHKQNAGIDGGECARQMHAVGATKSVRAARLCGVASDAIGEVDRANAGPIALPFLLGLVELRCGDPPPTPGGGECCKNFRVRKKARNDFGAGVPDFLGHGGALLFDKELHERVRIEV